jgi:hypothetical protein
MAAVFFLATHVLEVIYINDVDGIPLIQSVRLIYWPFRAVWITHVHCARELSRTGVMNAELDT